MIVLAIDTALAACQAALVQSGEPLAVASEPMERGHQERLALMVAGLFTQAGCAPTAVDRVVVTLGPGSFTGLRVGIAFAKGLALGLDRPLLGIGTLHALAAGLDGRTAAVIAAPHGRTYLQLFDGDAAAGEPALLETEAALALCRDRAVRRLTGPAAEDLAARLDGVVVERGPWPDPVRLARLGAAAPPSDSPLLPLYLRGADAKTIAERAALKAAHLP